MNGYTYIPFSGNSSAILHRFMWSFGKTD